MTQEPRPTDAPVERTIRDAHGVDVYTRWWTVASPSAVVLVSHGASEHCARYDRFAQALNAAGMSVVALDHRGHGRTAESSGRGVTGPGGGAAFVDDLEEVRAAAAEAVGGELPVFLFGHSMGALLALAYLTRHSDQLAGGVLCGFPADPNDAAAVAALLNDAVAGGMRDEPFDALAQYNDAFAPARTAYDWLSRDPAEVDRYVADPLCGDDNPLTYGFFAELLDVVARAREQIEAITCPLLVIAGDQDPAAGLGAHATAIADVLRGAGHEVELTLYAGARHELLNETNRDEVTSDIVRWLHAHADR